MTGDYDWKIKDAVEETCKLQEKMLEQQKQSLEQQKKLIEAFNAVAQELRLLREELAPKKLDKPQSPLKNSGE